MRLIKLVHPPINDWLEDFDPTSDYLNALHGDIFTFWQRFPDVEPHYNYRIEWDSVAVLETSTFENWWHNQINKKTRNMVRKAGKSGVVVNKVKPDDAFYAGIVEIYNETPIRQRNYFKHYGETLADVKAGFGQRLNPKTNTYLGAYLEGKLIGFIHLIHTNKYALMSSILSTMEHRNKAVNNALIAKAVKVCTNKHEKYLIYAKMRSDSLGTFKKHNGFEKKLVPRYYIPLNMKGKLALKIKPPSPLKDYLPEWLEQKLRRVRLWYYLTRNRIKRNI